MQSWRATVIPLLAVPVSLLGTFAAFTVLDFTINTLTLFAMVLAIGLVVDDAIVVIENVEQHMERGLSPVEATEVAMAEVQGPVVAIAFVLSAVFIPIAFLGGMTGILYRQFALTIAVSMGLSAFVAYLTNTARKISSANFLIGLMIGLSVQKILTSELSRKLLPAQNWL